LDTYVCTSSRSHLGCYLKEDPLKKLKQDNTYWITEEDHLFLMQRIPRPDINSESHICVGEAIPIQNGFWEVRVCFNSDLEFSANQILIGIAGSQLAAVEVLWEQRNIIHWGYFQ
jgi:hypothetical protein